jgi:hypothetical protein
VKIKVAELLCDHFIAERHNWHSRRQYCVQVDFKGSIVSVKTRGIIMEINSHNDIEMENNSGSALPPPHFDAEMVSAAQPVEPLAARPARRSESLSNLIRRRLGVLIVILIVMLLGSAAFGMFLGLRDRQSATEDADTANQATAEPASAGATAPPVKDAPAEAAPLKSFARTERAELKEPEVKPVAPRERVRRVVLASPAEIDQALSGRSEQSAARKVGEIFGGGRHGDRRGRSGDSRRRERGNDNYE